MEINMGTKVRNGHLPAFLEVNLIIYSVAAEWDIDILFFQDELMYMLRKLLLNIGDFPAQTSHILFNYLVSFSLQ